jgi:PAS domain S-box-containing protein
VVATSENSEAIGIFVKEKVDVLIVDDRIDGLIALEAVLNIPEINLVKAQSGREALELLDLYEFGLILLDVQMPELDGFQTAELIRRNEKYQLTPVIFVTAINKDDRYLYRGYEAGAVDYIFKPFEPQILRAKVSVFVELFTKTKRLQEQAEIIRESERRERYLRLTELEVESLRRYRNLADAIPHIIWRSKGDGTLDYFNKGWIDYTGFSLEKSFGSGWQGAIHPDDLNNFLKIWMDAMAEGKPFEGECRILKADGEVRWFWVKAVAETNQSGQVVAWLGTCTDIHDRKMTEMKLIQAEQEAKAASLSKTAFLANMSHEIRTPMNAILGFAELMLEPNQSGTDRTKWVHTIQRNGRQLLKIIDEILDISKVEAGRLQLEKVEVNVGSLLEDVRSLLKLQTQDRGLEFEFNLDTPIPRGIISDPTRIRQILLNLVGNSIKFTKSGFVHVSAEWTPDSEGPNGKMSFRIKDSGVGINPDHVHRLFQPFVQEDSATTRNYGGTGLGLALSRQLARAMGGDVTLESSEPGKGSCFLVQIRAPATENTSFISNLDFTMHIRQARTPLSGDKRLEGVNVLLVEDVKDNQNLMTHFLGMAGAHVEVANNGKEGVAKAMAGHYDAILMDIQMPVLDGYEATRQLRAKGYKSPIIALTAHALKEEREKSFEVGCDDHLTKPIDFNVLIEHLAGVLPPHGESRVQ